ncbi:hypothetical protein LINPERPRIM_LOCUS9035, partial [Linum perenne]
FEKVIPSSFYREGFRITRKIFIPIPRVSEFFEIRSFDRSRDAGEAPPTAILLPDPPLRCRKPISEAFLSGLACLGIWSLAFVCGASMDLETENRIAAMLMREAAELRRRAEKEGVRAYLEKPTVRVRPNSRFLTATVLGVQQANRVVEVNEMWRVRQKEINLDERLSDGSKSEKNNSTKDRYTGESHRSTSKRLAVHNDDARPSCSSSTRASGSSNSNLIENDGGLKDEEIEEFLQSRAKRGRGAVGSRMDETGPFRPTGEDTMDVIVKSHRAVLGPEKPSYINSSESSDDESDDDRRKKAKKTKSEKKHSTKEKSRDKKRKRKDEKRRKKHR